MKKKISACLLLFSCYATSSLAGMDHDAMPMLVESGAKQEAQKPQGPTREMIAKQFSEAYQRAGEPTVAVFWNRKFDDQLSQWEATHRRSITGEGAFNNQDVMKMSAPGEKQEEDALAQTAQVLAGSGASPAAPGSYERNMKGGSRILASEYSEQIAGKQHRSGFGERVNFEFGAGYTQSFISNRVKVVDRSAIMRLIERDNVREGGAEMIADYQKVETDALIGYADYLAEILFTPDNKADLGMGFMVTVKEVATGRIVAMFKSEGKVDKKMKSKGKWVATATGFNKTLPQDDPAVPKEIGEQLAYETMQELAKTW